MVVIKHREEEKRHNYYKVTCDCGCVFAFEESEFENTRAVGSKIVFGAPGIIRCPDCKKEHINGSYSIVSISVEEYAKYSGFTLKNDLGLKQCPFCGSKWTQARYINHPFDEHHVYGGYRGECVDCGVTTKAYKTREEAVDAWNMRSCEVKDE